MKKFLWILPLILVISMGTGCVSRYIVDPGPGPDPVPPGPVDPVDPYNPPDPYVPPGPVDPVNPICISMLVQL